MVKFIVAILEAGAVFKKMFHHMLLWAGLSQLLTGIDSMMRLLKGYLFQNGGKKTKQPLGIWQCKCI